MWSDLIVGRNVEVAYPAELGFSLLIPSCDVPDWGAVAWVESTGHQLQKELPLPKLGPHGQALAPPVSARV